MQTATAEEVNLASTLKLELAAWQARLPLGELLVDATLQSRHRLLMLQLMLLATSCNESATVMHLLARLMSDDIRDLQQADVEYVQSALGHYSFYKQDLYQSVYLTAAAASPRTQENSYARGTTGKFMPRTDSAGCCQSHDLSRIYHNSDQHMSADTSVAALLAWLSRSEQTMAVLTRVLNIARVEAQLQAKVRL